MAREVTYEYYSATYGGSAIEEADWARLSQLASGHLERLKVLARVTPYGDEDECESMAICAMAEALQTWEEATVGDGGGAISSEHIGSVSVSYGTAEQVMPGGIESGLLRAARAWLHVCLVVA